MAFFQGFRSVHEVKTNGRMLGGFGMVCIYGVYVDIVTPLRCIVLSVSDSTLNLVLDARLFKTGYRLSEALCTAN